MFIVFAQLKHLLDGKNPFDLDVTQTKIMVFVAINEDVCQMFIYIKGSGSSH